MHTGSDRQTMVVMEASGWCGGGGGGGGISGTHQCSPGLKRIPFSLTFLQKRPLNSGLFWNLTFISGKNADFLRAEKRPYFKKLLTFKNEI